jgi:hypothetical protein
MNSADNSTVTLTSHCLCEKNVFTTKVLKSKLPLPAPICHCTSCRHVTGALYSSDARWPEPRANVDLSKLKIYSFSKRVNLHFCPTCSTPIFWEMLELPGQPLGVFIGTLTNNEVTPCKFIEQSFVGDTIDGGASVWLQHLNVDGSECRRFKLEAEESASADVLPQNWPLTDKLTGPENKTEDSVSIHCKCKGVDFILQRGDYSSLEKDELPWNVDPHTHKLLTVFCGCNSCRLQGGLDMWFWAFIEMKHLSTAKNDAPFPKSSHELKSFIDKSDPIVGSLNYYASSHGVLRFFCNDCSATVFFAKDERPEFLDVSVGLLDASDGARAEGFLSWSFGKVDFRGDADGGWREGLFDRVEKEAEKWRAARGYPKNWRRVAQEQESAEGGK